MKITKKDNMMLRKTILTTTTTTTSTTATRSALFVVVLTLLLPTTCWGQSSGAAETALPNRYNTQTSSSSSSPSQAHPHNPHSPHGQPQQQQQHLQSSSSLLHHHAGSGGQSSSSSPSSHLEQQPQQRSSYNLLSEAMSQAVSNEFSSPGSGSADGACHADDLDCYNSGNVQDRLGMEAIASLHRQLDDDDNGNIDLSESDDFLREELKYDSGYEKRQKAFHFNDDMHISVKELWEAWLRSEVHNWTIEQTTDWLAQSVQLPQYVELFKQHKVTGAALPRLAVNNLHYVSNVLGIKDPIHKQKISLKAMDVVLFGPPRETGTRWKDYILVTLLLSAIIGCWYAYQQNKNAKRHLRRMAQDMEGLQRAEQSLQEMQKELERARMEQENVATEKMDLERRLKEAPSLTSSSSDLEVQQLKKEIEMLRRELSRAEFELVDNCWAPPPQLQSWLQYTYELESKNHQKKRIAAEKQLQSAREACEKLRKKRSSLVGAFVSTHGKSIDDVDRSIVEARNALSEVTNELQERLHRWKQIETCLSINIVNNNGLPYLESVLYGRNGGIVSSASTAGSTKGSRARITSSTDDLDDESVQGIFDTYSRNSVTTSGLLNSSSAAAGGGGASGGGGGGGGGIRDDSSCSDDGIDSQSVQFYLGSAGPSSPPIITPERARHLYAPALEMASNHIGLGVANGGHAGTNSTGTAAGGPQICHLLGNPSNDSQMLRSQSTDLVPMEIYTYISRPQSTGTAITTTATSTATITAKPIGGNLAASQIAAAASGAVTAATQQYLLSGGGFGGFERAAAAGGGSTAAAAAAAAGGIQSELSQPIATGMAVGGRNSVINKKMVKQHSTTSQQSTSSTSSSVQSAPPNAECYRGASGGPSSGSQQHSPARWSSHERVTGVQPLGGGYAGSQQSLGFLHHPHAAAGALLAGQTGSLASSFGDTDQLLAAVDHDGGSSFYGSSNPSIKSTPLSSNDLKQQLPQHLDGQEISNNNNSSSNSNKTIEPLKKRKRRLRLPFVGGSSSGGGGNGRESSISQKSSSNESGKNKLN